MNNLKAFNAYFRALDNKNDIRLINAENERLHRQRVLVYVGTADPSQYQPKQKIKHRLNVKKKTNDITIENLFRWIDEKTNV